MNKAENFDSNRCQARTERVDFSGNASIYDRRHGAFMSERIVSHMLEVTGLPLGSRILDVGAGTGRVAIPFARKGYSVIAVDASWVMLTSLRQKSDGARVSAVVGDGTQLPFAAGSFDAAVIARLLYLIPDWQRLLLETLRVLKPGSPLFHEWGNGGSNDDWVQIREKARALFEAVGVRDPFHPGVRIEEDVDAFLAQRGARPIAEIPCEPDGHVTMREFLSRIESGECSYTWKIPPSIHASCVTALLEWAQAWFDLERPIASGTVWKIFLLSK
ncbi:MAG TPA: class I SAM-dependent methyltransferase [Blastocatellia bacterium]|nr:class I SAM-dependent methyltransferase [Blastocatellia bacterium]